MGHYKPQNFCIAKETIQKTKIQQTEWEKIFANDAIDKAKICKIYKQCIQLNNKNILPKMVKSEF